jgi:DNA polymerase-3 subunit delta
MLHRQVRFIVLAKDLKAQKKSNAEIQSKLGLSDFPLQKTLEQADKYSLERLKMFYDKLLETDLAIKTGKYDGELALYILVVELCQR